MTQIFDGKSVAALKKEELVEEVAKLTKKGIKPKLVSVLVGDDPASKLYLSLKKKAASDVGANLIIKEFKDGNSVQEIIDYIQKLNNDKSVHGIMLQLPLPNNYSKADRDKIINTITAQKDVDGMREGGPYITPVIKAILIALKQAVEYLPTDREASVAVVGSKGFVGSRLMRILEDMQYQVVGLERNSSGWEKSIKEADVVISATGVEKIITGEMIIDGAVVIDVGSPKPDVDKDSVMDKASFLSPVPGGVGPLTVILLIENLIESTSLK